MAHNIYNLIILDRSGSMTSIRNEAVNGVNETLGTIRAFAKKHPESKQYVSLVTFCSCSCDYLYENADALQTKNINPEDFEPCCSTPLYDAIGNTCTTLHKLLKGDPDANVSVTIITDGYENSSTEWKGEDIKKLIDLYKKEGWLFAYIGADHDVESVALSLSITNTLQFHKSIEGTKDMFEKENNSRTRWMRQASCCKMKMDEQNDYFSEV